jgi:hypothetical protein
MDALEFRGAFWLPETPDRKVSGILKFDLDGGGRLSLIGELIDPFASPAVDSSNIPRILGVRTNGFGLTLDNCFQTRAQYGLGSLGEQTYHVGMIFEDVHYEKDEVPEFHRVVAELRHLRDWTGLNSIRARVPFPRKNGRRSRAKIFSVSAHALPRLSADVDSGVKIAIQHNISLDGDSNRRSLAQSVVVDVRLPAPLPLSSVARVVSSVQNLVSICTDRVAQFDSYELYHPDLIVTRLAEPRPVKAPFPVKLHVEWIPLETSDKPFHGQQSVVPFTTLGGIQGVAAWVRTELRFEDQVARVMASRYAKTMFADDRLFNRTAALEGLHRQITGKDPYFAIKLTELAAMAGDPFTRLVVDVPKWVSHMKVERNDHAHHLGGAANATGATRYYLAESAYWLFVMCMFRQCDYPDAVFDAIERSGIVTWVKDRLVKVLT